MMFSKLLITVGFAAVISALPVHKNNLAFFESNPTVDTALQFPTTNTGVDGTISVVENIIHPRRIIIVEDGHLTPGSIGVVVTSGILTLAALVSLVIYCVWDCRYRKRPDIVEANKWLAEQAAKASKDEIHSRFPLDLNSPAVCHLGDQQIHASNKLDHAKPAANLPNL